MASFSISSLLLYIALSAVLINSYPIDNICKRTKNQGLCYELLGGHSRLSLPELERITVDATLSKARGTYDTIKYDLPSLKDPNLVLVYKLCSNYYSNAIGDLDAAVDEVKARKFIHLPFLSNTVYSDAVECEKTFSKSPSVPVPFASDNTYFAHLGDIFVVVSKILAAHP